MSTSVLPGVTAPGLSRRGWATLLVLSAVVFLDDKTLVSGSADSTV